LLRELILFFIENNLYFIGTAVSTHQFYFLRQFLRHWSYFHTSFIHEAVVSEYLRRFEWQGI